MNKKTYITLKDLEVYQLSRQISRLAWNVYQNMLWQDQKYTGSQFLRSADSIGANIAEGYGRYHTYDKIRFYHNSRGSLFECSYHWLDLLREREQIDKESYEIIQNLFQKLSIKLQNFIQAHQNKPFPKSR